ncbi:MAG: pyruvate phosphate dikinase PEP/pyruvate-binding protein, partial [Symploca sp. SIO2E6]|nr:pyruvate phosphate dikinase PEP/pyruvate-binding protein [Symploca sp. SIO2E6]
RVVSGQVTPEQYRVYLQESGDTGTRGHGDTGTRGRGDAENGNPTQNFPHPTQRMEIPTKISLTQGTEEEIATVIEGSGDLPPALIQQVAILARELENRYHGIPQDLEWTYDGQQLWLLQARPITTLQPIWTRKIAAEVIPGLIRPLTWSINRPLTCGVWGEIFTLVLGKRAAGLDFNQTATLHYGHAYFNASLLGQIFRRMGLPAESLEFLTRGAKFSKPPTRATLRNLPGLLRLLGKEWNLEKDFELDYQQQFAPTLSQLSTQSLSSLSPLALLERIDLILEVLKRATYYSIMAPLSSYLRQAILRVQDTELDNSQTPEVASLRSLAGIATDARHLLSQEQVIGDSGASLFTTLAESPDGQSILEQFEEFLEQYGYLSEVATDIAVPTWKEDPRAVRRLFTQFLSSPPPESTPPKQQSIRTQLVQVRLDLKGQVTQIYSQLLAQLRWSFVALETTWLQKGLLSELGDIFFLEFAEICSLVTDTDSPLQQQLPQILQQRRTQLEQNRHLATIPSLVYGNNPPVSVASLSPATHRQLQGIGASPGKAEGLVKVVKDWQSLSKIDRQTILVVPYTDSGWAPLLAQSGGLIAEVGGRLSHGAIVAREYGIPAVMDIDHAIQVLHDGQRVRIDGLLGIVEVLD